MAISAAPEAGRPTVYVSHRGADSADSVGRLRDRLATRSLTLLGDPVDPSTSWADQVAERLNRADVMIVAIGPRWNPRRLFDDSDWIRNELDTARRLGMKVFPVLFDGARVPSIGELPPELGWLTEINFLSIRSYAFNTGTESLVNAILAVRPDRAAGTVGVPPVLDPEVPSVDEANVRLELIDRVRNEDSSRLVNIFVRRGDVAVHESDSSASKRHPLVELVTFDQWMDSRPSSGVTQVVVDMVAESADEPWRGERERPDPWQVVSTSTVRAERRVRRALGVGEPKPPVHLHLVGGSRVGAGLLWGLVQDVSVQFRIASISAMGSTALLTSLAAIGGSVNIVSSVGDLTIGDLATMRPALRIGVSDLRLRRTVLVPGDPEADGSVGDITVRALIKVTAEGRQISRRYSLAPAQPSTGAALTTLPTIDIAPAKLVPPGIDHSPSCLKIRYASDASASVVDQAVEIALAGWASQLLSEATR